MTELILKFERTDNGNCRVYYRRQPRGMGHGLRCFQEDRPGEFTFYVCSKDGEPDSEAKCQSKIDRLPDDDSATATAFRKWWQEQTS